MRLPLDGPESRFRDHECGTNVRRHADLAVKAIAKVG